MRKTGNVTSLILKLSTSDSPPKERPLNPTEYKVGWTQNPMSGKDLNTLALLGIEQYLLD
jgi:hypothetical protein